MALSQHGIRLTDELHIDILDTIMNHFDIVPGAVWRNIRRARLAVRSRLTKGERFAQRYG